MNNMERRAKASYNHSHLGQTESWVHIMWHLPLPLPSPAISFGTVLPSHCFRSLYLSIRIGSWDKEDFISQNLHKGISNDPQEVEDTKRTAAINRELTRLLQEGSGTRGALSAQCWLRHQKPPLIQGCLQKRPGFSVERQTAGRACCRNAWDPGSLLHLQQSQDS